MVSDAALGLWHWNSGGGKANVFPLGTGLYLSCGRGGPEQRE